MARTALVTLIVVGLACTSLRGQDQTPPSNFEHLKPLDSRIGHWVADVTDPAGQTGELLVSWKWALNKNFIIGELMFKADDTVSPINMLIIGWDPSDKQVKLWSYGADGGLSQSVLSSNEGGRVVWNETHTTPDGETTTGKIVEEEKDGATGVTGYAANGDVLWKLRNLRPRSE